MNIRFVLSESKIGSLSENKDCGSCHLQNTFLIQICGYILVTLMIITTLAGALDTQVYLIPFQFHSNKGMGGWNLNTCVGSDFKVVL